MTDSDIYRKALARYREATHENTVFKDNVIVFLEKEIDRYREKIESSGSGKEVIFEDWEHFNNAVRERIKQLDQTLTTSTDERTSDSGIMTINYSGCYQDLVGILLANGYFVCHHVNKCDKKGDETITIEFWKE